MVRNVKPPEPFVDIHCHMLPGLDDGAANADEAMAEIAVADGIGTIAATPHQLGNFAKNSGQSIRRAAAEFQSLLDRHGLPLRVLPGADVRIEPDLIGKIRTGEVVSLADRRRHGLLELPHDVYIPLDRLLDDLRAAGLVGILSPPERNRGLRRRPEVIKPLVRRGCLLQVTAGSLTGDFGSEALRMAETLIAEGLVHFISTDAHGTRGRPPRLGAAFRRAAELVGHRKAVELCCRNPSEVVFGAGMATGCQKAEKSTWLGWLRQTFVSGSSKV